MGPHFHQSKLAPVRFRTLGLSGAWAAGVLYVFAPLSRASDLLMYLSPFPGVSVYVQRFPLIGAKLLAAIQV